MFIYIKSRIILYGYKLVMLISHVPSFEIFYLATLNNRQFNSTSDSQGWTTVGFAKTAQGEASKLLHSSPEKRERQSEGDEPNEPKPKQQKQAPVNDR